MVVLAVVDRPEAAEPDFLFVFSAEASELKASEPEASEPEASEPEAATPDGMAAGPVKQVIAVAGESPEAAGPDYIELDVMDIQLQPDEEPAGADRPNGMEVPGMVPQDNSSA